MEVDEDSVSTSSFTGEKVMGKKPGCFVFRTEWEGSLWKQHVQFPCSRCVAVKGRRD